MVGLTSTRLCAAAVMTKTYLRCIFWKTLLGMELLYAVRLSVSFCVVPVYTYNRPLCTCAWQCCHCWWHFTYMLFKKLAVIRRFLLLLCSLTF
jgi:hypothetical protein